MSKNIVIQEGGLGVQLTVDKLKTNLQGGGTCLWGPQEETALTTKTITQNGTYKASDDGYYGYSQVTVSGIGTASGTGPDGEDHEYTETGTGGVTDKLLPASIAVTTLPTKTSYTDGETIDYTGMVVKGYLRSGELWTDTAHPDGVIPVSELSLPSTAHATSSEYSDGQGVNALKVEYVFIASPDYYGCPIALGEYTISGKTVGATVGGRGSATIFLTRYNDQLYAARQSGNNRFDLFAKAGKEGEWVPVAYPQYRTSLNSFTAAPLDEYITNVPESSVTPSTIANLRSIGMEVLVQYTRDDGKTLEASFTIGVT